MDKYPTRLDRFRRWAKAMEQGAEVTRPNWDSTKSSKTAVKGGMRRRRPRRKRFRRKRRTSEE